MRGDKLPIVAGCQVLLNAYRLLAKPIVIDGNFGPDTQEAVKLLQKQNDLKPTGIIDAATWQILARGNRLSVHDSVDVFDPAMNKEVEALKAGGAQPGVVGGMCNGVAQLQGLLAFAGVKPGKLVLLRLQGHGNRGKQVLSYGTGHHLIFDAIRRQPVPEIRRPPEYYNFPEAEVSATRLEMHYSGLSLNSLADPAVAHEFVRIAPYFHPFGSVEFHGCQVGGGADGERFLQRVADLLRVPAVGALHKQYMEQPIRYHGPARVRCPGSEDLRTWAKKLPEIRSYD